MTHGEALMEAQRRWGTNNCWVRDCNGSQSGLCEVAKGVYGYYLQGKGPSFEAAFADADRRAALIEEEVV